MKDPIIHLIRNSVDHGIETPAVRIEAGKAATGHLGINIRPLSGREIEMQIHDDGAGIDKARVIKAAVKMGLTTHEEANHLSDKDIYALIFRSGVSTSPFITDISGRGLGMAIVAEKISSLGGNIILDSTPGKGTTFIITLPVTLSTFRGIQVRVNEQHFILPTMSVERAMRILPKEIKTVESRPAITINNQSIALVKLSDVLNLPSLRSRKEDTEPVPVLVLSVSQKRIAFIVDEVLGEEEGMVKSLGPQLLHVRNIAGATLMGDGKVLPILHVPELIESASQTIQNTLLVDPSLQDDSADATKPRYILVAEDSITLRSLLRNIIESAGYHVKTAIDGMEAYEFLKNETFDLLVSDVEMPNMNGFELTTKIRGDKQVAETPVILVTALDSASDRQRGMEAGANAYIVKGSFEQSNLIETIARLI